MLKKIKYDSFILFYKLLVPIGKKLDTCNLKFLEIENYTISTLHMGSSMNKKTKTFLCHFLT